MIIYTLLLAEVVLWGMYPIFTHYFVLTVDPIFLVSISSLIASIPFVARLIVTKKYKKLVSKNIVRSLIPIAFFTAIGHGFLFFGTKLTSGVNTGLLLQVEPIYSLILGAIFLGDIIGKKRIAATFIMILGAMTIVYKGTISPNPGDIFILLTPLMYQLSHTFAKKLLDNGTDISVILAGRQLGSGFILLLLAFVSNKSFVSLLNFQNVGSATYLGLYLSLVVFLWYSIIKRIPLSVASSFLPLTAVSSLFGSVFFLKETISTQQYIGFILIMSGTAWMSKLYSQKALN